MHIPRRHRYEWVYWFTQGGRLAALGFLLWMVATFSYGCADGRLMFRPKPPLEAIPSQPKFVPSDQ